VSNISITRKCAYCKELIDLDKDNFVYVKDKYYHFDHAVEEKINMKRNKLSKEQIIEQLKDIQEQNKMNLE
jgi:glutaredoxin